MGPCYAYRVERRRPAAGCRSQQNLVLSRRPDFVAKVAAFIVRQVSAVVRVGGDFYNAAYARKWLAIMSGLPAVRFYFYTRSWRVPAIPRS